MKPLNAPKPGSMKDFLGPIAQNFYESGWKVKTQQQLIEAHSNKSINPLTIDF